jgi:hypothetical protein
VRVGIPSLRERVVARPCEAIAGSYSFLVVFVCGPFAAWGLRGKKSTPSVGLGGTGDVSMISKREYSTLMEGHGSAPSCLA